MRERILEVRNNDYGDPWLWFIYEYATGQRVGIVVPAPNGFEAINSETKRSGKGGTHRLAVEELYEKLGERVIVKLAEDLTETGIADVNKRPSLRGEEPLDFNLFDFKV